VLFWILLFLLVGSGCLIVWSSINDSDRATAVSTNAMKEAIKASSLAQQLSDANTRELQKQARLQEELDKMLREFVSTLMTKDKKLDERIQWLEMKTGKGLRDQPPQRLVLSFEGPLRVLHRESASRTADSGVKPETVRAIKDKLIELSKGDGGAI